MTGQAHTFYFPRFLWRSLLLSAFFILGYPSSEARDDWQLWMEQKWSVGLTKSVKLIGKTEERYRSDMSDFYAQVAFVGVSWKALPWLKLEPAYHYEWTEQAGRDTNDSRVVLHITPNWSWGSWSFEDRNRIESAMSTGGMTGATATNRSSVLRSAETGMPQHPMWLMRSSTAPERGNGPETACGSALRSR